MQDLMNQQSMYAQQRQLMAQQNSQLTTKTLQDLLNNPSLGQSAIRKDQNDGWY